jgi:hypothetical protein
MDKTRGCRRHGLHRGGGIGRVIRLAAVALGSVLLSMAGPDAAAQDDPPGRVGRIGELQGRVAWFDHESGRWVDAVRNFPLTSGDRLSTPADGRAELRVGSTTLRMGGATELEAVQIGDERLMFRLHAGRMALRIRDREVAREIEVLTAEARLAPARAGHYRVDRIDDTTWAASWRGEWQVHGAGVDAGAGRSGFEIAAGQRAELFRDTRSDALRVAWGAPRDDEFGAWALGADRRDDERLAAFRPVSPEMTGAEELDAHGRWEQHPEHGPLWIPLGVRVGWEPYRYGRWVWLRPWGWTWVDEAPWGFAPFHYGRWVRWGGRWGWVPGPWVARPVFAPALVAWIGGPGWQISVRSSGPPSGWVPLAPREVYVPWYRHSPAYGGRINVPARPLPPPAAGGHGRGPGQAPPAVPGFHGTPPGAPIAVRPVPGGAVPMPPVPPPAQRARPPVRREDADPSSPRAPREGREIRDVRDGRPAREVREVPEVREGRKTRPDGRHLAREMEAVR